MLAIWNFAHVLTAAVCITWWGSKVRMEKFAKWWRYNNIIFYLQHRDNCDGDSNHNSYIYFGGYLPSVVPIVVSIILFRMIQHVVIISPGVFISQCLQHLIGGNDGKWLHSLKTFSNSNYTIAFGHRKAFLRTLCVWSRIFISPSENDKAIWKPN